MNCYRVEVITTNAKGDTTYAPKGDSPCYIQCKEGVIYIHGGSFSDVEGLIDKDSIKSIELLGPSLCA